MHAIAHKYNLNPNKNISFGGLLNEVFWNTQGFDVLLIFGHNSLLDFSCVKTFLIPSKKLQCKVNFTHKLKSKH